jgi:hypothetical protein
MKQKLLNHADQMLARAGNKLLNRPRGDSFNIIDMSFLRSGWESARYYELHMSEARLFDDHLQLISHALTLAKPGGLCLEFGVATGSTISHIASHWRGPVYGFDSFEGLPENWYGKFRAGSFAGDPPLVPPNVTLLKGWFSDTLPEFVGQHREPVSFLHVDCDLYSSTRTIFECLAAKMLDGCVIVFDEFFNYPGWKRHEYKAFKEFVALHGFDYRYEGLVPGHQQVCAVLQRR